MMASPSSSSCWSVGVRRNFGASASLSTTSLFTASRATREPASPSTFRATHRYGPASDGTISSIRSEPSGSSVIRLSESGRTWLSFASHTISGRGSPEALQLKTARNGGHRAQLTTAEVLLRDGANWLALEGERRGAGCSGHQRLPVRLLQRSDEPQHRAAALEGVVVETEAPEGRQLPEASLRDALNLVAVQIAAKRKKKKEDGEARSRARLILDAPPAGRLISEEGWHRVQAESAASRRSHVTVSEYHQIKASAGSNGGRKISINLFPTGKGVNRGEKR
uniref:Uncharacterized protein n=1 Tax=Anopheles atroparvus TaxID=41427 RepID=A0A182J4B5_ANOAO